jgi:small subunit ribosomal protein S17
MEKGRGIRKTRVGLVVSDKMDKTVVVEVKRLVAHPLYHKIIRRRMKIKAHDPQNRCSIGDKVLLEETRPISRDKHWRVKQILEKAQ